MIAILFLGACSQTGNIVAPERQFPLGQGETGKGELQTRNLTFTYQYKFDGNKLSLNGDIEFARRPVHSFRISIHFVDADGIILDSAVVQDRSPISGIRNLSIKVDRQIPQETLFLAFSYRGEIGEQRRRVNNFWRVP
jgi:hypothetical protein